MIRKCSEGDRNACTDQKNIRERKTIKYFKRAWKMDICKVKWGEVCRCITFCFVKKEQNRNQADRALSLITEKSIWYEAVYGLMAPLGNLFTSYLKFGSVNVHLLPFTRQITIATHYYCGILATWPQQTCYNNTWCPHRLPTWALRIHSRYTAFVKRPSYWMSSSGW